jgi:HD-GYP domain-containing protein (c-di-GMP phosphodiesterase class II)
VTSFYAFMDEPRLAEMVGALSLATDMAAGVGLETALRTCVVATGIGRSLGLADGALADVYYTALLRFIGCTAYAHETAALGGGDDVAFLGALHTIDDLDAVRAAREGQAASSPYTPLRRRLDELARFHANPQAQKRLATAHCELAVQLAGRLKMTPRVALALGQMVERWDGRGHPVGLSGEAIALEARIMHLSFAATAHASIGGPSAAVAAALARRGKAFSPALVDALVRDHDELLAPLAAPSVWEMFLAAEPEPWRTLPWTRRNELAQAFASYVDLKSPFTLGHSTGVARLAEAAARVAGLPAIEIERTRLVALLHDLGRVSVPNGIWDKPGPLNPVEWERVREHCAQTERILNQSPLFADVAESAAAAHERVDGSGYPRRASGAALPREAELLAASDAFYAMTEERAYRPPLTMAEASQQLSDEARAGRLDRAAVEAVLAAAGQPCAKLRPEAPAGLTDREVEVIVLLARGLTNKEIANALSISTKTAQHHVAHIFEKTGVNTRAAAATFAVVHGLVA